MSLLTPPKAALAGLCLLSAATAVTVACTGDDPILTPRGPGDDAAIEASTSGDAATDAGDASDAGADGGGTCSPRDTTPCGCRTGDDCCIGTGAVVCVPGGSGEVEAGCDSTTTIQCVASSCGTGKVCCYNGRVSPGAVCPKRMTAYDTRCADQDLDGGPQCVELPGTPSARLHELTCIIDDDCTQYDAGTCVSALMDGVNRVMGVCVR